MAVMAPIKKSLLVEIDAFLAETGMGESYFGKAAVGNSELVARLRSNKRVWPETAARVRSFIKNRRCGVRSSGDVNAAAPRQPAAPRKPAKKSAGAQG